MNEWEQCISEWADRNMKLQQQLADAQAQIEALQKENRELNLTLSRCEKVFDRAKVEYQGDTELSLRQFFVKYQSLEKQVEALQRERNELREMTKIICGHCCEPIAKMLSELSILPIGCSREQELAWKMAVKNFRHYQRDYAADVLLQTALTPAGQRWTRSKPTAPGWYWWRVSPNTRPDLVLLRKGWVFSDETVLCDVIGTIEHGEWSFSDKRGCLLKDLVSGEFQGPLTPNEAME